MSAILDEIRSPWEPHRITQECKPVQKHTTICVRNLPQPNMGRGLGCAICLQCDGSAGRSALPATSPSDGTGGCHQFNHRRHSTCRKVAPHYAHDPCRMSLSVQVIHAGVHVQHMGGHIACTWRRHSEEYDGRHPRPVSDGRLHQPTQLVGRPTEEISGADLVFASAGSVPWPVQLTSSART